MREIFHPFYTHPNKCWTEERRERVAALHRKRHGAPDGYCTVHGVHVPADHGKPVRYWADWFAHNHGKQAAKDFILGLQSEDWVGVSRLRELWERKKAISANKDLIRDLTGEAYRANQNSR